MDIQILVEDKYYTLYSRMCGLVIKSFQRRTAKNWRLYSSDRHKTIINLMRAGF